MTEFAAPSPAGVPTVGPASFLTLHYRLSGDVGDVVRTFDGAPSTLSLGQGQLSPALEALLVGLREGDRRVFHLDAGEAFGQRNPEMLQWIARKELDELGDPEATYAVGEAVEFLTPDAQGTFAGVVVQVRETDGAVLFDFNHPLAGRAVEFEVEIVAILEA